MVRTLAATAAVTLVGAALVVGEAAAASGSQSFTYRDGELHGFYTVTVERISATALRVRTEATFRSSRDGRLELFSGCYEIYCSTDRWEFLFQAGSNRLVFEHVATGSGSEDGSGSTGGREGGGEPGSGPIGQLPILGPLLQPILGPIVDPVLGPILNPLGLSRASRSRRLSPRLARLRAAKLRTATRAAEHKRALLSLSAARLLPVSCGETTLYVPGQALVAQQSKLCVP
jgi:hypothetical protein